MYIIHTLLVAGLECHLCEDHLSESKIAEAFVNSDVAKLSVFAQFQDGRGNRLLIFECQIRETLARSQAWEHFVAIPPVNAGVHRFILEEGSLEEFQVIGLFSRGVASQLNDPEWRGFRKEMTG
jgi:hypothetical protein